MDAARWLRARELFEGTVSAPEAEWRQRLADACPDDADLREQALGLLIADREAGEGHSRLVGYAPDLVDGFADESAARRTDAWIGRQLGAWRIVRAIGRGGMGVVYLAERQDGEFHQQAALKMLRGRDDSEATNRLVAERQILANLEHPNIARLLDGGSSEDSGPWFALEYVDGVAIDAWCDSRRLDIAARLRLFLEICGAVSFAHEHLVVHRDLKPGNILVDASGRVILLDFGIAKLLDTSAAQTGTALRAFTAEYAAPEQIRGEVMSTAVDVYALGVILCELLSGRRPYRVTNPSAAAFERAAIEQDALRPSTLVTGKSRRGTSTDVEASAIADRRALTPQALRHHLQGDLDAVVLKALRKEPSERYSNVRDMAADIRAMLSHRPVHARRGGLRYVARRFLWRNRIAVAMASLAVLALVAGLVIALGQAHEARLQRDTARQSLAFMTQLFENADPGTSEHPDLTVRDLLEEGVRSIDFSIEAGSQARADLMLAMASAYMGLELPEHAMPLIEEAKTIARLSGDPVGLARAVVQECRLLNFRNEFAACEKAAGEAERLLDPTVAEHADLIAELVARRIGGIRANEQHADLIAQVQPALARLTPSHGNLATRTTLTGNVAQALSALDRHQEAEVLMRALIADLGDEAHVVPRDMANAKDFLSEILNRMGRADEALQLNREALSDFESLYGVDNPINSTKMNNLAVAFYNTGHLQDAISMLQRVVDINRKRIGSGLSPAFSTNLANLGVFMFEAARYEEALRYLDEAISRNERSGVRAPEMASTLWWRGALHLAQGRLGEARADVEHSEAGLATLHPPGHPRRLRTRYSLLTLAILENGSAALTQDNCRNADDISAEYAALDSAKASDVAFAGFLVGICKTTGTAISTERSALLKTLDSELQPTDFRLQFARQIDAAL